MLHDLAWAMKGLAHRGRAGADGERLRLRAAKRGEGRGSHFDRPAHVVDLLDRGLVGMDRVIEHKPEDIGVGRSDPGAAPVDELQNPEGGERAKRLPDRGPRDAELGRERALRGDRVADPEALGPDAVVHDPGDAADQSAVKFLGDRQDRRKHFERNL